MAARIQPYENSRRLSPKASNGSPPLGPFCGEFLGKFLAIFPGKSRVGSLASARVGTVSNLPTRARSRPRSSPFSRSCARRMGLALVFHICPNRIASRSRSRRPKSRKLEKDLKFPRLIVYFSESAARLDDLKKPSIQGVELQPHLNGTWHWVKDDILAFEPGEDWPAAQTFRVVFDKKFFPSSGANGAFHL